MKRFAIWSASLLCLLVAAAFAFGQPIAWAQATQIGRAHV